MVTWLPADGDPHDIIGINNGTLTSGASYAAGLVGQAFSFDGTTASVLLSQSAQSSPPLPNVSDVGSMTFELWIRVDSYASAGIYDGAGSYFIDRLISARAGAENPVFSLKAAGGQFGMQVRYDDLTGLGGPIGGNIVVAQWTHVAMVREYGVAFHLYVDGALAASSPDNGRALHLETTKLGHHFESALLGFVGLIDEFGIYSRALSQAEIQAIVGAGGSGKCTCALTAITTQPASSVKSVGDAVTFSVAATGNPISFQWKKNGVDIPGATGASYTIASLATSDAGDYTVVVADCGSVTSTTGTLTVNRADQTINFPALADQIYGAPPFGIAATASSGLAVSFAGTGSCSVASNIVTILTTGSCSVTASQLGNAEYNAAPDVQRAFTVSQSATEVAFFLHGSGANAVSLYLDGSAPTGTSAAYRDSPSVTFAGGNLWKHVATWSATAAQTNGQLTALGDARLWLGLKNSDDQGTRFDVRVEVYRNSTLLAFGETYCVQGVTRNPNNATEVAVAFAPFASATYNGTSDVLSLKVSARIGTNGSGSHCGGHNNAVGLRSYFDSASRDARFIATF